MTTRAIGLSLLLFAMAGQAASTDHRIQSIAAPFAPGVMSFDDRITLTPGFSPDGQTAYFAGSDCAQIGPCPQTMRVAQKVGGAWQSAGKLGLSEVGYRGRTARVDWPSVSPDGTKLLFSWSAFQPILDAQGALEDFALWQLDLTQDDATPELIRGVDFNRARAGRVARLRFVNNETSPVLTDSGRLYFWTERLDGLGERDLYRAEPDGDGGYGAPQLLPAPLNSAGRDNHLWVNPSESVALVTYNERGGEGGADIFISRKVNGVWSDPAPLGPLVNGSSADFAGKFTPDGAQLVFTSTRSGVLSVWSVDTSALVEAGVLLASDLG